jgi:catechol 2,3-dioxygenase-like lactoylglutathione lyase family enzyme
MTEEAVFNHVGHCVTDLARARRFYEELFGFEFTRQLDVLDQPAGQLLRIAPPLGMTAVYLRKGGLVLELMCFDRPGNPPVRPRLVNEPGLTHLSISVDDIRATAARAVALGGEVLGDTDVGAAVFVRDPDGQLVELLPMSYRRSLQAEGSV